MSSTRILLHGTFYYSKGVCVWVCISLSRRQALLFIQQRYDAYLLHYLLFVIFYVIHISSQRMYVIKRNKILISQGIVQAGPLLVFHM